MVLWLALTLPEASAGAATKVELELVLAVDVSSSVNRKEYTLQMRGLAEAFRSEAVLEAIAAFAPNGVAVTLMQWGGLEEQGVSVPWLLVRDAASAEAMADGIDRALRLAEHGGTALGEAMLAAGRLFENNGYAGARRVIDVSGDGHGNLGVQPEAVRANLLARGIVINGLAILNEEPELDRYYATYVIGGGDAFVVTAADYDDFASAIQRKLVREIAGARVASPRSGQERDIAAARFGN